MDSRIKILIVEDEALIADEIRRTLTGLGYEVTGICYDYASAAAAIPHADADLFMLDINLGGNKDQGGVTLASLIKATNPTPFIFLTAYSDTGTISKATAQHPANYLIKPVNAAALFAAIQLAIARADDPAGANTARSAEQPHFFYVKVGANSVRLLWQDVYCIEAAKNYVRIFSTVRSGDYAVRGNIGFVMSALVPEALRDGFFKLGRGICLSRRHVSSFSEGEIVCGGRSFENGGRISARQFEAMQTAGAEHGTEQFRSPGK